MLCLEKEYVEPVITWSSLRTTGINRQRTRIVVAIGLPIPGQRRKPDSDRELRKLADSACLAFSKELRQEIQGVEHSSTGIPVGKPLHGRAKNREACYLLLESLPF